MEEKRFLGVKLETLTAAGVILGPSLTVLLVVAAMLNGMNSNIIRLADSLDETNANLAALTAQVAANGAALEANSEAIEELRLDIREVNDDIDALNAEVVGLRLETVEIKGRVANIERQLPDFESVDGRLDNLERGQAALTDRVDALAAGAE